MEDTDTPVTQLAAVETVWTNMSKATPQPIKKSLQTRGRQRSKESCKEVVVMLIWQLLIMSSQAEVKSNCHKISFRGRAL